MSWDILKIIIASAFTIFGTILAAIFLAGVNKFNNVCNRMIEHDFKIKDLVEQVDVVDNKIDHIEESIKVAVNDLKSEINPIHKRVEEVELDIKKIKIHTKFDEVRSNKNNR